MSEDTELTALAGSTPRARPQSAPGGPIDPASLVDVTIHLRPRTDLAPGSPVSPLRGAFLTRSELAATRGASPRDVALVENFARSRSLEIVEIDPPARRVRVRAGASLVAATFGVEFQRYEHPQGAYRTHLGPVMLPTALLDVVVAVLGLDSRTQATPKFLRARNASAPSYSPSRVAELYGAPAGASAPGVRVALIELGGGFATADIGAYFDGLGIVAPSVSAVEIDGGRNEPTGSASGPDTEVMLDIEVVGAVARGANIVVYFCPNTDQGFADAILAAVHDTARAPHIISISWGGPESGYTAQAISVFEAALSDAARVGVSVFVAAGDGGSSDGVNDGDAHVDYPASSPQVVGCGGTHIESSANTISAEVVWNDLPSGGATGGGVSSLFPVPTWQADSHVPPSTNPGHASGRGVPDVAADADPESGYQIRVDGEDIVVGGTSAVAPFYAALAALAIAQAGSAIGFVTPHLYQGGGAFRDITVGDNGAYQARAGWDPCTGLGAPKASALIALLASLAMPSSPTP
ncbi:MAG TPA: S53 family peptidase [Acidimicrobiales bacterium]|jgi:kumamolisin